MRTRNADKPKPVPAVKSSTSAKKSAVKTPQKPPEPSAESSATPKSSGTKRTRAIQAKNNETQDTPTPKSAVEEAKTSAIDATPEKRPVSVKKVTRVVKKKVTRRKTPASATSSSLETSKLGDTEKEESSKEEDEDSINEEPAEHKEVIPVNVEEPEKKEAPAELAGQDPRKEEGDDDSINEEPAESEEVFPLTVEEPAENKEVIPVNVEEPKKKEAPAELVGQSPRKEEFEHTSNGGSEENKEAVLVNAEEYKMTELPVEHVKESVKKDDKVSNNQDVADMEEAAEEPNAFVENVVICQMQKDVVAADHLTVMVEMNTLKSREPVIRNEDEAAKKVMEKTEIVDVRMDATAEPVNMDEVTTEVLKEDEPSAQMDMEHGDEKMAAKAMKKTEDVVDGMDTTTEPANIEKIITEELEEDEPSEQGDENMEEQGGEDAPEEFNEGVLAQDYMTEHGEKSQRSEEESVELTALTEERRKKRELEIFVRGLDRDAADEDVRKVFQHIGEVEVQVHKDPSNSKNKGYAFVKFATKEQAKQALAEIKYPVINGKRCGTAPCEDNSTLFLGNICNTWAKEAIRQKLNDYGIDGVENITLVSDPKYDGLSRGFAFIEFSCHGDAMLAYKRLQKPDVIFGHLERTAKVAFAEPLREPHPEVMAHVKSVFVDGLPPHWDEDHVRNVFKGYGVIEQITLARNMSSSKRKDFGFVDFSTHEAAVACIDDINTRELGDGNSKAKVKARLSNPLPKTQVVKGEMCGGFRIGRASSGASARGSGRGAHPFNRNSAQRGRDFYHHGRGQTSRMGFPHNHDLGVPFRGRESFGQGGRWGSSRGAHVAPGEGTIPPRFNLDRSRHGAIDRVHERHMHFRGQPFPPEEFDRPFQDRHSNDPHLYSDRAHGIKRPLFTDQDPRYMEPSRVRPRLDYADPAVPFHGPHHRDTFGSGSSSYPHDYYGPNYSGRGDIRPSFYRGARPHRGGYYY